MNYAHLISWICWRQLGQTDLWYWSSDNQQSHDLVCTERSFGLFHRISWHKGYTVYYWAWVKYCLPICFSFNMRDICWIKTITVWSTAWLSTYKRIMCEDTQADSSVSIETSWELLSGLTQLSTMPLIWVHTKACLTWILYFPHLKLKPTLAWFPKFAILNTAALKWRRCGRRPGNVQLGKLILIEIIVNIFGVFFSWITQLIFWYLHQSTHIYSC